MAGVGIVCAGLQVEGTGFVQGVPDKLPPVDMHARTRKWWNLISIIFNLIVGVYHL